MEKDRHMFPGGNTPAGFFSYYQYILPQDLANHIFCIKGGPGVGKSTFMKGVGRAMGERGYAVEYMHCSSDPGSLDGLVVPGLKTALIDGTAPHVVDPKNPGAVDEIVNLGECWDLPGIKKHRQEIMEANAGVGRLFARAYRYLAAARALQEDGNAILSGASDETAVDAEMEKFMHFFSGCPKGKTLGRERRLFATAITPEGLVSHLGSLLPENGVYEIRGAGCLTSAFLQAMAREAVRRGLDVEEYYCPMAPADKLEHLNIPGLRLAFATANGYHAAPAAQGSVDFGPYTDKSAMDKCAVALRFDGEQLDVLLNEAVSALKQAKELHDHMETFYVPNMDFGAIAQRRNELVERILSASSC